MPEHIHHQISQLDTEPRAARRGSAAPGRRDPVSAVTAGTPACSGQATIGTLANVVWLVVAGVWLCLLYLFAGVLSCLTIIGLPFGVQSFKLAGYALWPFNRVVIKDPQRDAGLSLLGNVAWFLVGGWWLAIAHVFFAIVLAVTIIGAPLALASLKMAGLALAPFGKRVVSASSLAVSPHLVVVSSIR